MGNEHHIIAVRTGEGQKLNIAGGDYRIIVAGTQTNGSFAVIEMTVPPGAGPLPHSHTNFEESFYVLEGEINFRSEAGDFLAVKDDFINIPKGGIIHCFKNMTDKPAKLLCTVIPSGLEEFFIEVAEFMDSINNKHDDPGWTIKENMARISEKYGQKLYPPDYLDH